MFDEELPKIRSVRREAARVERRQPRRHLNFIPALPGPPRRDGGPIRHPLVADDLDHQDRDHLKPFTGIVVAVGLSIPIWIIITGLLYYLI
jgi:hypothetical protein